MYILIFHHRLLCLPAAGAVAAVGVPGAFKPNSHRPPDTTLQSCMCRVSRWELSRPDCPTSAFCVGVRPAVALRRPTHSDTDQAQNAPVWHSSRLNSHCHTRHDKTVLSGSCLVCRCELDDCCERVQTSNFLSATVLSGRESNSHR